MHRILRVNVGFAPALLLGVPTTAAATAASHSPVAVVAESAIAWEPCPLPESATPVPAPTAPPLPVRLARECAKLAVPLDYDEPDGATLVVPGRARAGNFLANIPSGHKERPRRPGSQQSRQGALGASTNEEDQR